MNYKKGILDLFDERTSDALQSFCKCINTSKADVFVIMAHKAICLFKVLQEQNYINIGNKTIISNLSLDFETENFNNKKIAIIDDIMISGTAVSSAVNKAISCGVDKNNISVIVLAVDTDYMRMQFINELDMDVLECDTYWKDNECIKLSSNLSNAFSYYGIPYDYDFPIYEGIRIDTVSDVLFHNFFWNVFDISNDYQKRGDICLYLIIPKKVFLNSFYRSIGINFNNSVNFKIKIYIKNYANKEKEYIITSLCLFNEIKKSTLESIFEFFKPNLSDANYSLEAKTRYLQYYLSHRLFLYFSKVASFEYNKILIPNDINILFGNIFGNKIYNKLVKHLNVNSDKEIVIKCENMDLDIYKEYIDDFKKSSKSDNLNSVPILLNPFIWWYDKKEIPVRNSLKASPANFLFDFESIIKEKTLRLNSGFSFNTLVKILNISSEEDKNALSIFIDRSIDLGILVPTIYYNKKSQNICRIYRHGEDLPFALADQIRLLQFLLVLEKNIKDINYPWDIGKTDGGIAHVSFEKMIVAFYQIGVKQGNIFNRFLGFDNIDIMKPFLSVHGRVNAIVNPKEINEKKITEHFYSEKVNLKDEKESNNKEKEYEYIKWLSVWLNENDFIFKIGNDNKERIFIDKVAIHEYINKQSRENIDKTIYKKIEKIGVIISKWYNYTLINGGKDKFKEDATALTSCKNINVFSSAIATEIHYFSNYWNSQAKDAINLNKFSGKDFMWAVTEQGLKSGRDKKDWYDERRAKKVIDTISNKIFVDSLLDWNEFWDIEDEPYPKGTIIIEKLYEAIGYLYFYSACYDCLKSDEFWEKNVLPDTLQEYERKYKEQCNKVDSLENNLFDIFTLAQNIRGAYKKRKKMAEEISKVIPCSEKTVYEIEECLKSSKSYYTVKYKSSLIFEVNPICKEKCDDYIMNVWNQLKENDVKTQLNIIRFNEDFGNDNYIKYGLFFGIIKNNNYAIDYKVDILIDLFSKLCAEFNCKSYSIRAILIPQIPSALIFEHNTYKNISTYSEKFYRNCVSALENMFIDNKYYQLMLLTTKYMPANTKEVVNRLRWDTVDDIDPQSLTYFTGKTSIIKYSNETLLLNGNPEMRVSNSVVKIECGNSVGAGLLVKTDNQIVCITCNHIVANYLNNNKIISTMVASKNAVFDLIPIKPIMPDNDKPHAAYEVAILEPQWNGKIPFDINKLISLNDLCDIYQEECDCCGFPPPDNDFIWVKVFVSRALHDGYMQLNNVNTIEKGFSGGVLVNKSNKIVGIHEGRFNDMNNGIMIPSSIIKEEIFEVLGDY